MMGAGVSVWLDPDRCVPPPRVLKPRVEDISQSLAHQLRPRRSHNRPKRFNILKLGHRILAPLEHVRPLIAAAKNSDNFGFIAGGSRQARAPPASPMSRSLDSLSFEAT